MKLFAVAVVFTLCSLPGLAQTHFETLTERPQEKSLIGFLSKEILQAEPSFGWFQENYSAYQAHAVGLAQCKQYRDSIQILAFMGTWCDDSHFVIPRLFALAAQAELDEKKIVLLGVNRKKETWGDLTKTFNVSNVPTLIVLRDGKEIGRVVEYGKYGQFDRELGEIIQQSFSRPR
jgi:thiol-disulfide isomerase/thioredoxin